MSEVDDNGILRSELDAKIGLELDTELKCGLITLSEVELNAMRELKLFSFKLELDCGIIDVVFTVTGNPSELIVR